jgi:hypothetical protein
MSENYLSDQISEYIFIPESERVKLLNPVRNMYGIFLGFSDKKGKTAIRQQAYCSSEEL